MKKLILLMLAVLCASALAYKLPTAWTLGGGLSYDSVRVTIYRPAGHGASLTSVKDTTITGVGTGGNRTFYVDSLGQHIVRYMYFSTPDTFREYTYNNIPIDYTEYVRNTLKATIDSIYLVMDSLREQSWAEAGTVTLSQADIDSIVAGVIAGTIGSNGTGIFAVTLYARDTINNAFVPGINLTAVSGATNLFATTGSTGAATFNVDAATWTFNALGSPYTWVPFSRTVAGNITDTITGGGVLVAAPGSPNEATVYGTLIGGNGELAANWDIRFTLEDVKANLADTSTGQMVVLKTVETSSNSSGQFSVGLIKTENLLYKSGTAYKHPVWRMVASPSDVKTDPRIDFTFSIPSDSTSIDVGLLIKEGAE